MSGGINRPVFPTVGANPDEQRLRSGLRAIVSAMLDSGAFVRRLLPGSISRPASGVPLALAWGEMNRLPAGNVMARLPKARPEWIGQPLTICKGSPTGTAYIQPPGASIDGRTAPTVDGVATGFQMTAAGQRQVITDGVNWFTQGGSSSSNSASVASGFFPPASAFRLPAGYSPVGLWYFDSNLNDSSGNGLHLQVEAGAEHYAPMFPGVMGAMCGGASGTFARFLCTGIAAAPTLLAIKGDASIEMIVTQDERPSPVLAGPWVSYAGAGGLEADNALWSFFTNIDNGPEWYQEAGASVPSTLGLRKEVAPPIASRPIVYGARRASGILQFFVDGKPYGSLVASGLTLPTGGTSSEFRVGGSQAGTQAPRFLTTSIKVVDRALTDAQFLADYNASLGQYYGVRS